MIHCLSSRDMASRSSAKARAPAMANSAAAIVMHCKEEIRFISSPVSFDAVEVSRDIARVALVNAECRHRIARHEFLRIADPEDQVIWRVVQHAGKIAAV